MNARTYLLCFGIVVMGCEPPMSLPPSDTTSPSIEPQLGHRMVTIKGDIIAKSQIREFLGVDALVTLEQLSEGQIHIIAATIARPNYDTGFNTSFELTYHTQLLKKKAQYYIRVTAKKGNLLWKNNIFESNISNPYQPHHITINVEALPL